MRRPPVFGGGTGLSGGTEPDGGTASELRIIQEDKFHVLGIFDVFILVSRS